MEMARSICNDKEVYVKYKFAALLVFGVSPLLASAASIEWTVVYDTTYSGTSFDDPNLVCEGNKSAAFTGAIANNPNWVHQFDVYFQVHGLASGDDVKAAACDLIIGGGLTPLHYDPYQSTFFSFNNYEQASWQVWRTVPPPAHWLTVTRQMFGDYGDAGTPDDLLGLMCSIGADVAMHAQPAENAPQFFGSFYATWDGTPTTLTVKPSEGSSWVTFTGNAAGTSTSIDAIAPSVSDVSTTLDFVPADLPEPATMALLAVGGLAILKRRRR